MLRAYLSYAGARVTLHGDPSCSQVQRVRETPQRCVILEAETIGDELERFARGEYGFGEGAGASDMWLDIEFRDAEFEHAVARYVHRLLATYHERLRRASVEEHCGGERGA